MKKRLRALHKIFSVISGLTLVFNSILPASLLPIIVAPPAYAQDATQSSITEPTVSPTSTITVTPTEVPTPTENATATPEPTIVTPSSTEVTQPSETGPPEQGQIGADGAATTATPTETPITVAESSATIATPIEKVYATEGQQFNDSTNEYWNIDLENGVSETKGKVELGVKYIFPQENKVTVTFTALPKDENLRTPLKIQRIKISNLNLPDDVKPYGEYAYDITTGMTDGTFEYDITLPKPENQTGGIVYKETSNSGTQTVSEDKTSQEGDKVKASGIDHFTIFIATYSDTTFSVEKSVYTIGETVYVKAGGLNTTKSYKLAIDPPSGGGSTFYLTSCFDPSTDNTTLTGSYLLPLDAKISTNWKAELKEYDHSDCSDNSDEPASAMFTVQAQDWPNCTYNCTANDINTISFQLVKSDGSPLTCTYGTDTSAYIKVSYNNQSSGRYAAYLVGDIYQGGSFKQKIDSEKSCLNTMVHGQNTYVFDPGFTWSCGQSVEIKNLTIAWDTSSNTCSNFFSHNKCYPPAQSFCGGSVGYIVVTPLVTNFSANNVCLNSQTSFTDGTTGGTTPYTYDWNFGDLSSHSTTQDPTHTYLSAGTYSVTDHVTDASAPTPQQDSFSKNVSVWVPPAAGFSASEPTCPNNSVTFTNSSAAGSPNGGAVSSYLWDFGDSSTSTATNPTHNFSAPGTYTVTLTANDANQCNNQTQQRIVIPSCAGSLVVHKTFTDQHSNSGITINLSGDATDSKTTNTNGDATFTLPAGTYTAHASEPIGYYESGNTCVGVGVTNGNTTNCTITDSPILGTITVHKDIIGTSTAYSNFCFTLAPDQGNGQICANASGDAVFSNVPAGTYTANETAKDANYTQTATTCNTNMIIANNGDSKSCTVTNTRDQGDISFLKVVSGGTSVSADWTFTISGGNGTAKSGDTKSYDTGSYAVTESGPVNYTLTNATGACSLTDGVVTLAVTKDGGTCTITNTRNTGDLKAVKIVDDRSVLTQWKFALDGGTAISANSSGVVDFGQVTTADTHTITESGPDGYHFVSVTGTNCTDNHNGTASATVTTGGTTTCTFTNNRDVGTLTIHKQDQSGNPMSGVAFAISGTSTGNGSTDTSGNVSFSNIPTGPYTVTETVPTDYHFTSADVDCSNANPSSVTVTTEGQSCTFVNTRDTGTVIVHKDVQGPNGENVTDTSNTFTIKLDGTNPKTITDAGTVTYTNVLTGDHTVTESIVPTGYTLYGIGLTAGTVGNTAGLTAGVAYNQTTDVYVTNRQQNASVTIHKNVINPDGAEISDTHSFAVKRDGADQKTIAEGTDAVYTVVPGTYIFTENSDGDYTLDSIVGDNDTNPANGASITVTAGGNAELTFVNKQKVATITVEKNVVKPDGVTEVTDNHSFSVTLNAETKSFSESAPVVFTVNPGTYSAVEAADGNYTLVSNDSPATVGSNGTATIHIVNKQKAATITVVKDVVKSDESAVVDNHTFTALLNGTDGKSFSENSSNSYSVNPGGPYTIGEGPDDNYTLVSCKLPSGANATEMNLASNDSVTVTCTNKQNPGTISGHKLMADGVTGIAGWIIDLYRCVTSGTDCSFVQTTTTGAGGTFSFTNLVTGFYQILEGLDPNYTPVGATSHDVTVTPGSTSTNNNFSNFKNFSISGEKYNDLNGNGNLDGGEPGIENWTINLYKYDENGTPVFVTSTKTDANGDFTFTNLGPATYNYKIAEESQSDWIQTEPADYYNVTAQDGRDRAGYRFGNFKLGKITACKYIDLTGNGQYEPADDQPLENIDIVLSQATSPIDTQSTGEDGCVTFDGLTAGTYRVEEDYTDPDLDGYYSTNGITHYDVDVNSGTNETKIFLNALYRTISGTKYNDLNGDGSRNENEPGLPGWTIFIDYNNDGNLDAGEPSTTTDADGNYEFTGLAADSYTIAEELKPGWSQTQPTAGHYDVDVHTSITSTGNDFGNTRDTGTIELKKVWSGTAGQTTLNIGTEADGSDIANTPTGVAGADPLTTGTITVNTETYYVSETGGLTDYNTALACTDNGQIVTPGTNNSLTVAKNHTVVCTFTNTRQTGKLLVHKLQDDGSNAYETLDSEDFTWGTDGATTPYDMGTPGQTLNTGSYDVNESSVPGYQFQGWFFGNPRDNESSCAEPEYTQPPTDIAVYDHETTEITLCNQAKAPSLTITKENFAGGDKHAGDNVLFQITVTNLETGGPSFNTTVTDLPAGGFKYRTGSWTSNNSNGTDLRANGTTTEPTYASPGVWKLGTLQPGEIVTLTYIADIDGGEQPGLYKDLAYANGKDGADNSVYATSESDPTTTYVGTQVNVVGTTQNGLSHNVIETVESQVLGASTELPATGANTFWLYVAFALITGGISIGALGWFLRRKYA